MIYCARRKFRTLGQLSAMAKALALSSLRERYPQTTEPELRRFLAAIMLGEELAATVSWAHLQTEAEEDLADAS